MATPVIMPRQGQSVESCIIAKWHKNKGDKVNKGDLLFTYETDKASFDEEAPLDGTLLEIFREEEDDVPVLTNVCVIGEPGEDVSLFRPDGIGGVVSSEEAAPGVTEVGQKAAAQTGAHSAISAELRTLASSGTGAVAAPAGTGASVIPKAEAAQGVQKKAAGISPRAKNLAERTGVNYTGIYGSGPGGRITEKDILELQKSGRTATRAASELYSQVPTTIEGTGIGGRVTSADLNRYAASGQTAPAVAAASAIIGSLSAAPADYTEIKMTNIRKVIANAMFTSLSTTAQLTLNNSFDATEILDYRQKIKSNLSTPGVVNITLNDMILFATAKMLMLHRNLNTLLTGEKLLQYNHVHLGVAVDTERGLMVPTIFNADTKSLAELSIEAKNLTEQCRKGTINPDLLKGGTFTVTNLGGLGIESFTPVLNSPQVGILGVNNITDKVRNVEGKAVLYPSMGLSLTFDHRAVDGAPAARFLKELADNLQRFSYLLAQ